MEQTFLAEEEEGYRSELESKYFRPIYKEYVRLIKDLKERIEKEGVIGHHEVTLKNDIIRELNVILGRTMHDKL